MRLVRTLLVACLFAAPALTAAALPAQAKAPDFARLDKLMSRAVADSVFPGASLAVIYKGRTVYHRAVGNLTYNLKAPLARTTTIYDAASLTKPIVTTSIAMQLVERDSLDLHHRVSRYLPRFAVNGKKKITIEQLMRHNSGLRGHDFYAETCRTPDEVFSAIEQDSLLYKPGKNTRYSDLGFILLGRIIEQVTGQSLFSFFGR